MTSIFKSLWGRILIGIVVLLIAVRIALPIVVLKKLNDYLSGFSPVYSIHINDLRVSLLRMAYSFEDATAIYKKDKSQFFKVESIDVSIAWRELFKGRISTDIAVNGGEFVLTKALLEGSKDPKAKPKDSAKDAAGTLFPVRVSLIEIHNSAFDFADLVKLQPASRWRVSEIEGKVFNFTPTPTEPITFLTVQGTLLDSARFKAVGKLKKLDKPLAWKIDTELRQFDLVATNPILMKELPFTFTAGKLDMYSELRSQNGKFEGYVKPFMNHVTVLPKDNKYAGVKHFLFEIVGAVANVILRRSDDKVLATRVAFHEEDGKMKVDTGQAVSKAIKNGFSEPLKPGIEDSLDLK